MQYQVSTDSITQIQAGCIVVTIDQSGKLSTAAQAIDKASNGFLSARFANQDIEGKAGQTLLLPVVSGTNAQRVLLVGTGKEAVNALTANKILNAIASATGKLKGTVALAISELANEQISESWLAEQTALAFGNAQYSYQDTKSKPESATLADTLIWLGSDVNAALQRGFAIAKGVSYAKTLGNLPPNICTPSYLAKQAEQLGADSKLKVTIIDEKELEKMGAGAFVSVAKGSSEPGKLIIMEYQGAKDSKQAPHMILGKGITFDTGGISLKPGAKMDEMKFDMCGAASVFGTVKALLELQPNINLVAMVASAENMPSGHASKPGDVITTLSGQTVEILNTDAEGRLVLCDALTYGINNYQPQSLVDIATLTGACMAALGGVNSGLFSQDDELANELQTAAKQSGDKVWRLPLEEEYQELLDSNFADIANIGGPLAGATTAACYLSRFTKGTRWAHLDIAGTAWNSAGKAKGSTGRPVPLLVTYLLNK
ncbi:MAG: leucyl aminopeptidase [Venatoribacter sp.]